MRDTSAHSPWIQGDPGADGASRSQALKLRHVLFFSLLLSGIIPLAISSVHLISQNRDVLQQQEKEYLVRSAEGVSRQVDGYLARRRSELALGGQGLLTAPGPSDMLVRLRQDWVNGYLKKLMGASSDTLVVWAVDTDLEGVSVTAASDSLPAELSEALSGPVFTALQEATRQASLEGREVYGIVPASQAGEPLVVLALPVSQEDAGMALYMGAVSRLKPIVEAAFGGRGDPAVGVLLLDEADQVLWSEGGEERLRDEVATSALVRDVAQNPLHLTRPFVTELDGVERTAEVTVSPIPEPGWRVVVLKGVPAAFEAVDRMIYNTLLSSLLLVLLALFFAIAAARWVGRPIQRLADTSHEIAAGKFGKRVETRGLAFEMADLAQDFNRMCEHVESYVEQLREAARANRELFIGSIRAFAAAIDAKDPYTRGHSERVAAVSRTVARYLGLDHEFQQQVWLGALLHDVGKIGVDDRILQKVGGLSTEEFDQMKAHTVIGAKIIERIDQLKDVVPAIRWHHENWNGRGYPDGLKGEDIPLIARVVAVADTFDAVTTSRPYQEAFTLDYAVNTIKRLTGTRFDAKVVTAFLKAFESGEVEAAEGRPPTPTRPDNRVSAAVMA